MAVIIAGVTCEELVSDYSEDYDILQGPSAQKKYLCPWADRFTVAHGFLGLSSSPFPGGLITLNLPLPFPELAEESTSLLASMYARHVTIQGSGPPVQGTKNIAFYRAIVTVTFGNFPWTFEGIDPNQLDPLRPYIFAEQHIDFSAEWITIPGTQVFFASNGKPVSTAGTTQWGLFMPIADMTITLKQIPYLLAPTTLAALAAPINSVPYLGCAAGFLLFGGGQDNRTKNADGTQTSDYTLNFKYRAIAPWDYSYNQANPGGSPPFWDQVTSDGSTPVIARSDLSKIIPSAYGA